MLRRKILNAHIRRSKKSQINGLNFHLEKKYKAGEGAYERNDAVVIGSGQEGLLRMLRKNIQIKGKLLW